MLCTCKLTICLEVDVTPKHCRELKLVEILKDRDDKPEQINKKD